MKLIGGVIVILLGVASAIRVLTHEKEHQQGKRNRKCISRDPETSNERKEWERLTKREKAEALCEAVKLGVMKDGKIDVGGIVKLFIVSGYSEGEGKKAAQKCNVQKESPEETAEELLPCIMRAILAAEGFTKDD